MTKGGKSRSVRIKLEKLRNRNKINCLIDTSSFVTVFSKTNQIE